MSRQFFCSSLAVLIAATAFAGSAGAQQLAYVAPAPQAQLAPQAAEPSAAEYARDDARVGDENAQLAPRLQRQIVSYPSHEAPGTIIVDTPHTFLYYALGNGKAIRYGIGVGREGFTWSGVKHIARKREWPDWYPPAEMIQRQPYLPRMMAGGPGNPLGARALYIGGTEYRIHGTNDPTTIGKDVSSGCIRLTNDNIMDLFKRVKVGAKVIVLPQAGAPTREAKTKPQRQASIETAPVSAYAPADESPASAAWNSIRPQGLY
jgi:lipoprotein-anchoring transpeptidase ErfK/SrfK